MEIFKTILAQMSVIEIFAAATALVNVYLLIKNSLWTWHWGLVSVLLYTGVFWQAKVYANMWLQIAYYVPMQFYGWWVWAKGGPRHADDLPITYLTWKERVGWLIGTAVICVVWGVYLAYGTNGQVPYWDAATAGVSVTAQFLQAKKKMEQWWLWLAVDLVYVLYLFPSQKLYVTTAVYAIFTGMAFVGMVEWRRLMEKRQSSRDTALV